MNLRNINIKHFDIPRENRLELFQPHLTYVSHKYLYKYESSRGLGRRWCFNNYEVVKRGKTEPCVIVNSSQSRRSNDISPIDIAAHLEDEAFRREDPGPGGFFWPTGGL